MAIKQIYEASVFQQTDGQYSYRCSCGARGGSYPMATGSQYGTAEHAMDRHVEKIHVENPMRRAREESLSVPDAIPNDDTCDAVQHIRPTREGSPKHADRDRQIARRCIDNRWMLFGNDELISILERLRDTPSVLHGAIAHQIGDELRRRGVPVSG